MVLASERMMELSAEQREVLHRLLPPKGIEARFDDRSFRVGRIETGDGLLLCLFNWDETPDRVSIPLDGPRDVLDYWTGEALAHAVTKTPELALLPRSARVLACV